MSNQKRIMNISLNNVRFWLICHFGPFVNITYFIEQKNSFALTSPYLYYLNWYWFHNPDSLVFGISFELLKENGILCWQIVANGDKIVLIGLFFFTLFIKRFLESLNIFSKQVFPANLKPVSIMVDSLLWEKEAIKTMKKMFKQQKKAQKKMSEYYRKQYEDEAKQLMDINFASAYYN